jgi:hypothetical protein
MKKIRIIRFVILLNIFAATGHAQTHPKLVLTAKGVANIKTQINELPLLNQSFQETIKYVEDDIALGIQVPVPKDLAGGYTHTRHKSNFFTAQKAGVLYQITGDEKYAIYIRDMFLEYAKLYPTLPTHPASNSYAPGKIFWQCLNDANWLVYMSQAYDCIYDFISEDERKIIEGELFRPFADFLSIESPQFFNRIHNHSTWGNAAVGMIGFVMNDEELIQRGLYGLEDDGIAADQRDNDGGLIKMEGQTKAGFIAQLDFPFSPDGYYTEGPYYQRYAMYPFLLMAESIENCKPELKIFEYRDSLLIKAVYAILNLTDSDGQFFPLNDAQKGMSYLSRELVASIDIIYHYGGNNPQLLSIAKLQNQVLLDDTGLSVAKGLSEHKEQTFEKKSMILRDGAEGDEGGLGIIRSGKEDDQMCLLLKYTSQGLSHGHFDKLSFSYYRNAEEILPDYGLARYVNIEQKAGGGYLPENQTWAKQTIAHNTLVVNKTSHFNASFTESSKYHSDLYFFDMSNPEVQIISAKDNHAYPGTQMHRTMLVVTDNEIQNPLLIDIFRATSKEENTYDLPYQFHGQILETSFEHSTPKELITLGNDFGYQHLWKLAEGKAQNSNASITWMNNKKFYTITTATNPEDDLILTRLGANDPNFNLRNDPSFIIRKNKSKNALYITTVEAHGSYSTVTENALNAFSSINKIKVLENSNAYLIAEIELKTGKKWTILISNSDASKDKNHKLTLNGTSYEWTGPYQLNK